jgi:hypothetical protein
MDEYKINQIVAILIKNEYKLSDGYSYYTDNEEQDVSETLREIAMDILKSIETKSTQ